MTVPMIFGIVGIVAFNLVDTFFVGKLGTKELSALSFTFPVVLVISSLAHGLGVGAAAVISRAIGEGNLHKVQRLTTDSLVLSFVLVAIFSAIGLFTINWIFKLLGASREIIDLIRQYMEVWYFGMIFVVIPMVGNNAIRATGDTRTPAIIMMVAVICNFILDPLLIFGIGPFPRMELRGAAIATVISRATTFVVALLVLHFRDRMLTFLIPRLKDVLESWKKILYIGLPDAATRTMLPLSIAIITRMVASYGNEAVAGYGVSQRIEFFALTAITALRSVIAPFVGQNWGAGKFDRLRKGMALSERFSLAWGVGLFFLLFVFARPIAEVFNRNQQVISTTVLYLRIVSIGYGLQSIVYIATSAINVMNKPLHAAGLTIIQMFLLYIPLAYMGSIILGIPGIFAALSFVYILGGIASHMLFKRIATAEELKTLNPH
jgi:putative MATE family efflux protein